MNDSSPEVRVRFDQEAGGHVVDLEVEPRRAGPLIAAIAAAARGVRAVIQRLELRPGRGTVGARIVLAPGRAGRLSRRDRNALVTAVLAAIQATVVPQGSAQIPQPV